MGNETVKRFLYEEISKKLKENNCGNNWLTLWKLFGPNIFYWNPIEKQPDYDRCDLVFYKDPIALPLLKRIAWSLSIKMLSMFTRLPPFPAIRSTKNSCGSSLDSTTILNFWREMNSESSSTKPRRTRIALHCGSMISRMISRRKTINQQLMQKAPSKGGAFCYGKNYQHNTIF